jgi:hypothetical protein
MDPVVDSTGRSAPILRTCHHLVAGRVDLVARVVLTGNGRMDSRLTGLVRHPSR